MMAAKFPPVLTLLFCGFLAEAGPVEAGTVCHGMVCRTTAAGTAPFVVRIADDEAAEPDALPEPSAIDDVAVEMRFEGLAENGDGIVLVSGSRVPEGAAVMVGGARVAAERDGRFSHRLTLPPGDHEIAVQIAGSGRTVEIARRINIPLDDWFYVALADLTAGLRWGDGGIEKAADGEFGDAYASGRLAFYIKGKIRGRVLLTAAADTGEGSLAEMFKGLDGKDPRQLLRRIDPDDYYPVYGDDSSAVDDAPTRGKFYVRLERDENRVMWGEFRSRMAGTRLLAQDRLLYGAEARYRSESKTAGGESRSAVTAYAAQPGTVMHREELRATGGSAYFLRYRDLTPGSETVAVEYRDPASDYVLARKPLRSGFDYDLDATQGLLLLTAPLPGEDGGRAVHLTVSYEFTPVAGDADGYAAGGRAEQWLGDGLRVGATALDDSTGAVDARLIGADIRVGRSDRLYLEAEVAWSDGGGFVSTQSIDGGLTHDGEDAFAAGHAMAYRVEGGADLAQLTDDAIAGRASAYYERRGAGFSAPSVTAASREERFGSAVSVDVSETLAVSLAYAEGRDELGRRGDATARIDWRWLADTSLYAFGVATLLQEGNRSGGNRAGAGVATALSENVRWSAELSDGDGGIGGRTQLSYRPAPDESWYLGYALDNAATMPGQSAGENPGALVAGARRRFSDRWTAFAENSADLFGRERSLSQTYGATFAPDANWSLSASAATGTVENRTVDPSTGQRHENVSRTALAATLSYRDGEVVTARLKAEARFDDTGDGVGDADSYYLGGRLALSISDDWRLFANLDMVLTDANETLLGGDYAEAAFGYAWRPADGDRFNALVKYSFLYDLPAAGQRDAAGNDDGPAQRSHIFSADASYDLTAMLTLGGKLGARLGEERPRDGTGGWSDSNAVLAIVRADFRVVKNWDALVEGRVLWLGEEAGTELGLVAAIYRHLGENMKIGAGYNFGVFSDDLRDLTLDNSGIFVNVIGKF